MDKMNKIFKDEIVQLWPGDTYDKFGKIIEINNHGIIIKITKSNEKEYKIGNIYFISYTRLKFKKV